ncbi:putative cytochrome P450 E-class, group I [Cercophora samala]|uniref:Cytochrome P450 E-class, group I n=1 Tax=Cercophora samala TaxID=330535 RepID=A0AA39Z2M8_9PEZI|nr:putative cytochrome P450 E-class, group I [Cercophora samala]
MAVGDSLIKQTHSTRVKCPAIITKTPHPFRTLFSFPRCQLSTPKTPPKMSHLTLSLLASLTELALYHHYLSPLPITPSLLQSHLLPLFLSHYLPLKIYTLLLYPFYFSPLRHLPTPSNNLPLLGQTLTLLTATSPVQTYIDYANAFPHAPFVRFLGLFNSETLLVCSPEAHKEVLQTHCYDFKKPDILHRFIGDFAGRGLLFAEGEAHRVARRALNPIFGPGSIRRMMGVFWEKGEGLGGYITGLLGEEGEGVIDVNELYVKATIDVTGATMLGVDLGNLRDEATDTDFLTSFRRVFQQPPLSALISFINLFLPIRPFLPIEANLGYLRASHRLRQMTLSIVNTRIRELSQPNHHNPVSNGADLLTMMLQNEIPLTTSNTTPTPTQITNELLTFLAAGHETTANALLWATYLLATRPQIQSRLRTEITTHLPFPNPNSPNSPNTTPPSYENLDSHPYLHNFTRELLRRYCPALMTFRQSLRPNLTIANTPIPKDTILCLLPSLASRATHIWGPDADDFNPDRWDNLAGTKADTPYAFGAFLHGPRVCIGRQFAIVEFKALLVVLVTKFEFLMTEELERLGGREPPTTNPGMGYVPAGGMRIKFKKI